MAFAALAAATTAGAQEERPAPSSCAGLAFEDAAGDQKVSVGLATVGGQQIPPPSPQKAKDNMDLRAGFFTYDSDGRLTANMQVTELTKELESGANGASWYFYFDVGGATRFVRASVDDAGTVDYAYGTLGAVDSENPGNNDDGPTSGRFIEGKDGIISIVVPVTDMALAGETLGSPNAQAKLAFQTPAGGAVPTADTGPDNGVGTDFEVVPCATPGKGTTATKSDTPANDKPAGGSDGGGSAPATGGGESTGTTGGGGGGQATAAPIKLRVVAGRVSARKAKRRFSVRLIPGEAISGLRATLYTGSAAKPKVFATGRIAKLTKARKLTLTVNRKRKLKAGSYTLAFTGRNAAGQTSTVAVALRVAK